MSRVDEPRKSLTLTEVEDANGFMRRTVHLTIDHRLVVEGHDLGDTEYEFERALSVMQTRRLAELLEEHGIAGEFWNRIGD